MANLEKLMDNGLEGIKKAARIGTLGFGLGAAMLEAGAQVGIQSNKSTNQIERVSDNEKNEETVSYSFGPIYDLYLQKLKERKITLNSDNDNAERKRSDTTELKNPEEYDLHKVFYPGLLSLRGLEEKKSLKEPDISNLMVEYLKRTQLFNNYRHTYGKIYSWSLALGDAEARKNNLKQGISYLGCEDDDEKNLNKKIIDGQVGIDNARGELKEVSDDIKKLYEQKDENIILENKYKKYLASAPKIFSEVERAREEAKRLLSGETYLEKLQKEFHCNHETAKRHQQVRISNIDFINYDLLSLDEINEFAKEAGVKVPLAFFIPQTNIIVLPLDLDDFSAKNSENKLNFFELALHEFLHAATNGNEGMSILAKKELDEESFGGVDKNSVDEEHAKYANKYYSEPTERYVRFKILEDDLLRLGVKKRGENFNLEKYEKMMELYKTGKLSEDANDFIEYTRGYLNLDNKEAYKNFKKIFDEIAMENFDKNINSDKTYKHPNWDYKNPSNLA